MPEEYNTGNADGHQPHRDKISLAHFHAQYIVMHIYPDFFNKKPLNRD